MCFVQNIGEYVQFVQLKVDYVVLERVVVVATVTKHQIGLNN